MIHPSFLPVFGRGGKIRRPANGCTPVRSSQVTQMSWWHRFIPECPFLPVEHHAVWLSEIEDGDLKALLKPYPAEQMKMWPVSSRVNSPKNNDPELLDPIS